MEKIICSHIRRMNTVVVLGNLPELQSIKDVVKTVFVLCADRVVKGKNTIYLADADYLKSVKVSAIIVSVDAQLSLFQLQDIIYHSRPTIIIAGTELHPAAFQELTKHSYSYVSSEHISLWKPTK